MKALKLAGIYVPTNACSLDMQKNFSMAWRIHRSVFLLQIMIRCHLQWWVRQWREDCFLFRWSVCSLWRRLSRYDIARRCVKNYRRHDVHRAAWFYCGEV